MRQRVLFLIIIYCINCIYSSNYTLSAIMLYVLRNILEIIVLMTLETQ